MKHPMKNLIHITVASLIFTTVAALFGTTSTVGATAQEACSGIARAGDVRSAELQTACEKGYAEGATTTDTCKAAYGNDADKVNSCYRGWDKYKAAYNACGDDACKQGLRPGGAVVNPNTATGGNGGGSGGSAPSGPKKCGGVDVAFLECPDQFDGSGGIEKSGLWGTLTVILNITLLGVGILAVGGIVYGALLYASAQDNQQQVQQARSVIRNVVIGLVAYFLMYALSQYLIPGGIFG